MNTVAPYAVTDMERMARAIAGSKLFGVQNPEQALALCLVAQAEGRHPATAAQDYHILQGRPAKKADAMLRDFLANGGKVQWHELSDTIADATFSHPAGGTARIDWTMERAKKAQLATAMWTKYPRQMLRARTVSEGVRTVFPMATSGMYVPEEVQDFGAAETVDVTPALAAPVTPGVKRLSSARAKEIGLHDEINAKLDGCKTLAECDAFDARFDVITQEAPLSWLDAIRNRMIIHREGLSADGAAEPASYDTAAGEITRYDARGNPVEEASEDVFPGDWKAREPAEASA